MLLRSLQLKEGYELREMGGEFHIFSKDDWMNGAVVGMPSINELGIFLWSKLLENATCEELLTMTMERNQCDLEDAEQDVGEFLAKLIHTGIVTYER